MAESEIRAITKREEAINISRRFLEALERQDFPIKEAYLYGSYVKGAPHEYSDIDVAVVSPKFSGFSFQDRAMMARIWLNIDSRLEPIPFRPEDFEDWHPLVHEIKKTGIKLVPSQTE